MGGHLSYVISQEHFMETYAEIEPLYREHYAEMAARKAMCGVDIPPYGPRLSEYEKADKGGYLLHFVARLDGNPVGYANCYLTNDMHNGELIGVEDTVFVTKLHRKGIGRRLMRAALDRLKAGGAKHAFVTAATDPRAAILWKRMGFKETAIQLTYTF